jgi:hypothetical protein
MNRFRSGLVPLFALLVLAGCSSEPTDDLRNGPSEILASPSQLFLEVGATKTVEVGAVDAQGNPLQFNYEVTETGPGIAVRRDSTFLPIFVDDSTLQAPPTAERFRFIVEGTGYAATSFTVSAGGLDVVIPVQIVPEQGLAATFDDDTVDLGQVVTLTAPAGVTFADTAFLTIGTDVLTVLSQDATTFTFIPPPSVNSPVTVNGVLSASAPGNAFAPATQAALVTPLIDTVDVTYSTVAPAIDQPVTMTVTTSSLIDLVVDSIIFPGQIPGREGDPQNIVVSADSSSVTFDTPPNIDGVATVVNFHFPGGYLRALPTRTPVTAPNIGTTIDATFDDTLPALLQPVTLTAPAGFSFDTSVDTLGNQLFAVTIGGNLAITQSVAGDGSTATVLPLPNSTGVGSIDGVVPDVAPDNIVTMLTIQTVTVPPLIPLEGTDDPATAPVIPAPGTTVDAGAFAAPNCPGLTDIGAHCKVYKLSYAAPTTFTYTLTGANAADLGLYFYDAADMAPRGELCDGLGRASPPESCSISLPAGEYILAVINFGPLYPELDPDPPFIEIRIE